MESLVPFFDFPANGDQAQEKRHKLLYGCLVVFKRATVDCAVPKKNLQWNSIHKN